MHFAEAGDSPDDQTTEDRDFIRRLARLLADVAENPTSADETEPEDVPA